LLDTNLPQNTEVDRLITGHLYGGDTETRIVQEKVLGIGGVRLLRKLGVEPSVYHLNEGHSAFLTLELAREFLNENPILHLMKRSLPSARNAFSRRTRRFPPETTSFRRKNQKCFDANFISDLKISNQEFFALGRTNPEDETEWFGMTPLALRMCRSANGVSEKHGEVSRELWLKMFPEKRKSKTFRSRILPTAFTRRRGLRRFFKRFTKNTSETIGRKFREMKLRGRERNRKNSRRGNLEIAPTFEKTARFLYPQRTFAKKPGCTKPLTNIRTPENYSVPTF
jgi:alpha-glucan phosphorylase-like protein